MKHWRSSLVVSIITSILTSLAVWGLLAHISKNASIINDGYNQFTVYLTLTTLMATMLAIAIAVVFGVNWLFMDKRIESAVDSALKDIDSKVQSELMRPLEGTTGYLVALMDEDKYGADEMANQVQKQLSVWGSIPNARTHVVNRYLINGFILPNGNQQFQPYGPNLESAIGWIEMATECPHSEDMVKVLFLKALRLAMLNEPDSCLQELKRVRQKPGFESFERLLERPLGRDIFALCGDLKDSLAICRALGIAMERSDLMKTIDNLPSDDILKMIGKSKTSEQIFYIDISRDQGGYSLSARPALRRTSIAESGYGTSGPTADQLLNSYKNAHFVLLCLRF